MKVHGQVEINIVDDEDVCKKLSPKGKPFIKMTFPDGSIQCITTNVAEMIGGIGAGTRKRWEDRNAN